MSSDYKDNDRVCLILMTYRPARNGRIEILLSTQFPRQTMCVQFTVSCHSGPVKKKTQYMDVRSSSMEFVDDLFRCMMSPLLIVCAEHPPNGDEKCRRVCHSFPYMYDFFHSQRENRNIPSQPSSSYTHLSIPYKRISQSLHHQRVSSSPPPRTFPRSTPIRTAGDSCRATTPARCEDTIHPSHSTSPSEMAEHSSILLAGNR